MREWVKRKKKTQEIPTKHAHVTSQEYSELCLTWERSIYEIDNTLCHRIYCKEKNSLNIWGTIKCDLVRDDERGLVVALREDILLTSCSEQQIGSLEGSMWSMTGDTWRLYHYCTVYILLELKDFIVYVVCVESNTNVKKADSFIM